MHRTASPWLPFWIALAWIAAFAAVSLDNTVVSLAVRSFPHFKGSTLAWLLKLPGSYPTTLVTAALVLTLRRYPAVGIAESNLARNLIALVLTGPIVGIAYTLMKWAIGRRRPEFGGTFEFHPFAGGWPGLLHAERGLSFPSGHTAMAFASAVCLAHIAPNWSVLFYIVAMMTGFERIAENAHYLSDVVAGAGVGILAAWMSMRIVQQPAIIPGQELR